MQHEVIRQSIDYLLVSSGFLISVITSKNQAVPVILSIHHKKRAVQPRREIFPLMFLYFQEVDALR